MTQSTGRTVPAGRPTALAWLPIPLSLFLIVALATLHSTAQHESPLALTILNFLFITSVSLYAAFMVAGSFLISKKPVHLLFLGAALFWAASGLAAVFAGFSSVDGTAIDPNILVTTHNTLAWTSAACYLAGGAFLIRWSDFALKTPWFWIAAVSCAALGIGAMTVIATNSGWTPEFFSAGQGPTPVRQFVLASAIFLLLVTAALLRAGNRTVQSTSIAWYVLALLMLAVGLFGLTLQPSVGSLIGWVSRATQYAGGAYLVIAARSSRAAQMRLGPVRASPVNTYGVALAITVAAIVFRLLFMPILGTYAPFLTFYPAVMLASLYAGFRAGVAATLASLFLVDLFLMRTAGGAAPAAETRNLFGMAFFFLSALMISGIVEAMHRAVRKKSAAEKEQRRLVQALSAQEQKFRTLVENAPDNIARYDANARLRYANPALERLLSSVTDRWEGRTPTEFVSGDDFNSYRRALLNVAATGEKVDFEQVVPLKDGSSRIISLHIVPETGPDGVPVGVLSIGRDISEARRAEESLRITASVFENSQEAIMITDADNHIVDVNAAFTRITGYSRDEALGQNPRMMKSGRQDRAFYETLWRTLAQNGAWRGEIWNRRKSGEIYPELLSISAIPNDDGKVQRYVAVFSDISRMKVHEAELNRIAHFDALTGVPNRTLLADRLSQAILRSRRSGRILAVCYLDLDGFKSVNDQLGHEAGDELLVSVTRRLRKSLRTDDTLARLGGDEFVVLFNDLVHEEESFPLLDRILLSASAPVLLCGQVVSVSASIGVTFCPSDSDDGDTLLRHADQAMYQAKQTGKNRYYLYDATQDQRVRLLHESRRRIVKGLHLGEFELHYQPKIELASGAMAGAEALIRWRHPERGLLAPGDFLPYIEDSDLEVKLGKWVLDSALAQLDRWMQEGLAIQVSINISARHLQSPGFVSTLTERLLRYPRLRRGTLQIEVLETAALEDVVQSSEVIESCRNLGVSFALDDFGTGYSSLTYLRKLSADILKIDQRFVRGLLTDKGDRAIVRAIVALADSFGRKTVAEGIEEPELIAILAQIGCTFGQGYAIARPMPASELANWAKKFGRIAGDGKMHELPGATHANI